MNRSTAGSRRRFLEVYARVGNIGEACRQANIGRATHYEWLADPEYRAAFETAKEEACDSLVEEARRRAHEGVEEPVYWQGAVVGTTRRYSDNLLMFLIKGQRPEVYRDQWKGELTHTGVMAISRGPDLSQLSDEQYNSLKQVLGPALQLPVEAGLGGTDPEGGPEEGSE
jgi:hypothetical protein